MAKLRCSAKSGGGASVVLVRVYSAAADYMTAQSGGSTISIVTNSSGYMDTYIPIGSVTFTSGIAKDPSNLSNAYSKTVNITSGTTEVYVMPDNCLYWYGYENNLENCSTANGWSAQGGYSFNTPTHNTNNIYCQSAGNKYAYVGSANAISSAATLHAVGYITASSMILRAYQMKSMDSSIVADANTSSSSPTHFTASVNDGASNFYIIYGGVNSRNGYLQALWYE